MPNLDALKTTIDAAFAQRAELAPGKAPADVATAIEDAIGLLDNGEARVAQHDGHRWIVNEWLKKAVLLYFRTHDNVVLDAGYTRFYDKVPLKYARDDEAALRAGGVRVVPHAIVRKGAYIAPNVVLMPSYVNIGARVGEGTMVDTWATVGSCAQIGSDCHLAGGVGIGGVLEPPSAQPVIVEDGVFVGSRAVIVEGVHVGKEAVIGAGVVLTQSTAILDVSGSTVVEHRGVVPPRSVVIPGSRPKKFPAGEFAVPCALILGTRKESTDRKVSLNAALRDFAVSV